MGVTYADRAANYCSEWGGVRLMEVPPTSIAGPAGTSRSPHRPIITAPLKFTQRCTRTPQPPPSMQKRCLQSNYHRTDAEQTGRERHSLRRSNLMKHYIPGFAAVAVSF